MSDDSVKQLQYTSALPVGFVDIFVFSSFVGVLFYWFLFRKPKKDEKETSDTDTRNVVKDLSFIEKMKKGNKQIAIFFGSQTGTAEEFSNHLAKDASKYGMKASVFDPEEYEMDDLSRLEEIKNSFVIFVVATYGEGDPTDNARELNEWLENDQNGLDNLKYVVFGLGNKTYEHYNVMGKYVDKRLEELGSTRLYDAGFGDDDEDIEKDFVTWKEKMWPAVLEYFGIDMNAITLSQDNIRQYDLNIHTDLSKDKVFSGEMGKVNSYNNQNPPYDQKNPFLAPVVVNRELHHGGDRSCLHIELDISHSHLRYDAGDHVAVYPINDEELVLKIGEILNVDLDVVFSLVNKDEESNKKNPFPCPTTYRTALLYYVDITSKVKSNLLHGLIEYAQDSKDKEFLEKITKNDDEGKDLFKEWISDDHRTIIDVLQDLPSVRPPIDVLLEFLPRLHCRYYSISSSSKLYSHSIHITAVVVDYKTRLNRRIKGVATTWLAEKKPDVVEIPRVPIFIRKTLFRLPIKPSTPVIMIGPGTGFAPFRGFIQERHVKKKEGKPLGDTILFFGCRHKVEDYIYEEEIKNYHAEGTISHLYVAFSRDQPEKRYVQHLIVENSETVWNVLNNDGHVYVCGDARHMAKDVHDALVNVVHKHGDMSESSAEDFIKNLHNKGKYSADVWS
ncbi:NADPH--cytochrome P450 reductase-like [Xenia sp. Carnegie-2017]|uniref:NADPH--cytochrome P450 reductase-like n=1 Tax=Xenia sp. Carnegie-2017 TaxID=2897299 RepID=UPI001F03816F|nr:NADPH--cytochrome P450 reductase-like [Xenia sp. Carnegie-2017]